jgi:AcrR family transcriptional regulator
MRDNCGMPVPDPDRGLRERKKIKTREAIQREAFRLMIENGYANTTVEQIAEAAEVSPSTFFRYFPSKESLLLTRGLNQVLFDALVAQPAELAPIAAFRNAVHATYDHMSDDSWEFERTRQQLLYSIPELNAALRDEYDGLVAVIAEATAQRLGRAPRDLEVRVFAGAMTGAIMSLGDRGPFSPSDVNLALDFLEAGMPLT